MSSPETVQALNQLTAILGRSFPQYLRYSRPYIPPGHDRVVETLEQIATDQDTLIQRVERMVVNAGAFPDEGEFPMEFTDTHDLGIRYQLSEAIRCGRQDVENLAACADSLNLAPAAKALAEEATGMTKGHLHLLEELANGLQPNSATRPVGSRSVSHTSRMATARRTFQLPSRMLQVKRELRSTSGRPRR